MYKFAILVVIIFLFLCGCTKENDTTLDGNTTGTTIQTEIYPNNAVFYSDMQLLEISDFEGTTNQLFSKYQPNYTRSMKMLQSPQNTDDAQNVVRVIYLGEKKALELMIDPQGHTLSKRIYNTIESKAAFDSLSIGQKLTDVQNLDPEGSYLFLYTGRNDLPKVSSHYTRDGFIIRVAYDHSNVVTKVDIESM